MKKQERIVTGINDKAIKETKVEVANYLILLKRAKDSLKELTEGNVSELDMELVDTYLNGKTSFKNGSMSAMAYNLQSEYNELTTLINNVNEGKHNLQFVSKGKVDDDKIETAYTNYLRDSYINEYLRIKEAIKLLNESDIVTLRHTLNLKGDKIDLTPQSFEISKLMR